MSMLQAKKVSLNSEVPLYSEIISEICDLSWDDRTENEMLAAAWAYYFFSIQFRENLELACEMFPGDVNLMKLRMEECNTDNLSPFPSVTVTGEKIDHDEFMWRAINLQPISEARRVRYMCLGERYLSDVRKVDILPRALSIASYEDNGLEQVFRAILRGPAYDTPTLNAFRFFLLEHIRFDSNAEVGHGALSRHLVPDDTITPLWMAFKDLFLQFLPVLACD